MVNGTWRSTSFFLQRRQLLDWLSLDDEGTQKDSGYCKLHPRQPFTLSLNVHPEGERKTIQYICWV